MKFYLTILMAGAITARADLTDQAAAGDVSAVVQLREAGPAGLAELIAKHPTATTVIDAVAKQKDASVSHLYWYTDFEKAKAAARASGKPILSLRLLGNLDEEFSCANSRFFRTVLYANADVSRALRDRFVLHWKSVRPVPKVTVDFGDGRSLERTLTGNSVHYILDEHGHVVDALPGLYGPKTFLSGLLRAESKAHEGVVAAERYHQEGVETIDAALAADFAKLNLPARVPAEIDDASWAKIAGLHRNEVEFDASSRTLIATKFPTATEASRITMSKVAIESPLLRVFQNLQRSVAEDTVRNEYALHRKLHEVLADGMARDVDGFNDEVYAKYFLTPASDPWLGLVPADTYSALPGNGLK